MRGWNKGGKWEKLGEGIAQGCLISRSRKRAKGRKPRKKGGNRKYGKREEWTPCPPPSPPPSDYGASLVHGSGGTSDLLFSSLAEWYVTVFHYR